MKLNQVWARLTKRQHRRQANAGQAPASYRYGEELYSLRDLAAVGQGILDLVISTWLSETAALVVREVASPDFKLLAGRGFPEELPPTTFANTGTLVQFLTEQQHAVRWPAELPITAQEEYALHNLRGVLIVPLRDQAELIGWLHVGRPQSGQDYTPEDVLQLEALARQAGSALDNALLYAQHHRQVEALSQEQDRLRAREQQLVAELETLSEIAQIIGSRLRLDELLPEIARVVQRTLDAPNFGVALYDAPQDDLRMALYVEGGETHRSEGMQWPRAVGLTGEILRQRRPLLTDDYQAECERRKIKGSGRSVKAWLGVPMLLGEELLGILMVSSFNPQTVYTEDDVRLLSTIAAQAAIAIANARLYERTDAALSRRLAESTAIDEIAREMNTSLDLQHVLGIVLDRAMAATAATAGSVAMCTPDDQGLILQANQGFPPESERYRITPWSVQQGVMGRVVRTNRPALIADVSQDPDYAEMAPSTRSELAVPIAYADRPIGVINLECDQPAAFDQEHQRFIQQLADHAAIAINNARLFQERERRITELAIFNEIGKALASSLDLGKLLETIHEQVSRLFDTTDFYIATYDAESNEWETLLDIEHGQRRSPQRHRLGTGFTGHIIRNRAPLLFRTTQELEDFARVTQTTPIGRMPCSWLGVPLMAADNLVGVMGIENYEQEGVYDEQDLALFSAIAASAAIAIANARLFHNVTEARDRLQAILDSTRDGVLLLDQTGHILLANPPIERWMGLAGSEVPGTNLQDAIRRARKLHPEARRILLDELRNARRILERNPQAQLRGAFENPGQDALALEWRSVPVLQRSGMRMARIVVLRDVTEEWEAARMREDLDSMIVHDLRGPLTIIQGSLETALQTALGPLTAAQRNLLNMAQEGTRRMQLLVDTLLDIRRLEAGKMPLSFAPTALETLAQQASGNIKPLAMENRLTITVDVSPALPPLWADEETLMRVLENLLNNAVKYSPPGQTIEIQATQEGQFVRCAVIDHGVGIPRAELDRVFEKFVQVHRTGKRRGSGLGLAFCRLAIEAHGGEIWVESEEGKGSSFYFTVPVWEGDEKTMER